MEHRSLRLSCDASFGGLEKKLSLSPTVRHPTHAHSCLSLAFVSRSRWTLRSFATSSLLISVLPPRSYTLGRCSSCPRVLSGSKGSGQGAFGAPPRRVSSYAYVLIRWCRTSLCRVTESDGKVIYDIIRGGRHLWRARVQH
ncbi:hypothetical protein C8Q74DRAFT_513821 [Fomes fomentarius]|nr:hypothetical protein C8Q74DRAFT_513821 [Fomes fomentarius]